MKVSLVLAIVPAVSLFLLGNANARWYSDSQLEQGQTVFQENCAACHGQNAEKTVDWKKRLPDGKYPPPPLNGTGHAWHHSLEILKRQIREGGEKLGGTMPPFKDKLSEQEMYSAIAYFQSKWPEKIYEAWKIRNKSEDTEKKVPPISVVSTDTSLQYLSKQARGRSLSTPLPTPVAGIKQAKLGSKYIYVSENGRYVFAGPLIDLKTGENLTAKYVEADASKLLDSVPDEHKVIYKAQGQEKVVIDVFTDTSCPYCRTLHAEIPQLQKAGVTVRYLPFPRERGKGPGYIGLKQVWCADNPSKAMDAIKNNESLKDASTSCEQSKRVDEGYELGIKLGIQGTPAIFLPSGKLLNGYVPYKSLLQQLGVQ